MTISRRMVLGIGLGAAATALLKPVRSASAATTTYYFDYVNGLDSNDGLSTQAPKKSLNALVSLIAPDNILRLRRGIVWPRSGFYGDVTLDIVGKNPTGFCTITDYDDALDPPILDGLEYDNSATGWTHTGFGRWIKPFSAAIRRVMFGGSPANLSIGGLSWKGSPMTDSANQWWWNNGTLHIYTGSSTSAPPVFYGGLAYVSTNSGTIVRIRNSSNLLINGLRTIGGRDAGWLFDTSASDNADIQLDDCEALYPGQFGFRFLAAASGLSNRRITLNRPVFDNKTDATENEGSAGRQGGSDGFLIARNYDDIVINDPTCIRARHAGINCYDEVGFTPGKLTVVARPGFGNFDSTVIEYGRALNLIGSIASQDTRVSGIRSVGQSTRSQLSGTCLVSGCSWKNLRFSELPGFEVSQAIWFQSWDLGPGNSRMVDVHFQNNLIENSVSAPIAFAKGTNTAGSFDANRIKLYNNTIVDETHNHERRPFAAIGLGFGAPAFQLAAFNNLISTSSAGADQVDWDGTHSAINGTTGFTGNVENIEGYVDRAGGDYHPTESGGLKHAGITGVSGALDSDGLPFNDPPSIAPTEFATP